MTDRPRASKSRSAGTANGAHPTVVLNGHLANGAVNGVLVPVPTASTSPDAASLPVSVAPVTAPRRFRAPATTPASTRSAPTASVPAKTASTKAASTGAEPTEAVPAKSASNGSAPTSTSAAPRKAAPAKSASPRSRSAKAAPAKSAPNRSASGSTSAAPRKAAAKSASAGSASAEAATTATGPTKAGPRKTASARAASGKAASAKATRRRATAKEAGSGSLAGSVVDAAGSGAVGSAGVPHAVPAKESTTGKAVPPADVWDERVAGALSFLRRRLTGQYEVDEFGFDPELTEAFVHPLLRVMYQRYFRVEVSGVEHLPRDSSALLVANHSGTVPMDALMLTMAVHDETPTRRHLRVLGADLLFRIPLLSELARKAGATLACNPDAERLMRNGEYVGVFPEGFKGIGKPYRDRYKLQRFGRGGFVSAALRTSTPIIPVSIVGAEEIYPIIANLTPLKRVTGLPYVPVTPLFPWFGPLGMLPLPSKWFIEFGEPIETAPYAEDADDPIVVFNLADQVRETIQQTLHSLLERRPDPFS